MDSIILQALPNDPDLIIAFGDPLIYNTAIISNSSETFVVITNGSMIIDTTV